jgi:Family of unknown function (DUF5677)
MKNKTNSNYNSHVNATLKIYLQFSEEIEKLRIFSMAKGELPFDQVVKSAYTKCYDFVIYCSSTKEVENAFFRLPGLRSLCEDLIVINYLKNQPSKETSKIIHALSSQEIYESIIVQENFLKKYNPAQILIPSELIPHDEKQKILNKHSKKGKKSSQLISLPSVFKMAKDYGLEDLYKYMYHASSKAVHFSIDTLLKMGWGNLNKETGEILAKSSYKNYYRYYQDFSIFYASYVFIKQTESFKSIIPISDSLIAETDKLMKRYEEIDWPELTTFDQLNMKKPSQITQLLTRSAFNLGGKGSP